MYQWLIDDFELRIVHKSYMVFDSINLEHIDYMSFPSENVIQIWKTTSFIKIDILVSITNTEI